MSVGSIARSRSRKLCDSGVSGVVPFMPTSAFGWSSSRSPTPLSHVAVGAVEPDPFCRRIRRRSRSSPAGAAGQARQSDRRDRGAVDPHDVSGYPGSIELRLRAPRSPGRVADSREMLAATVVVADRGGQVAGSVRPWVLEDLVPTIRWWTPALPGPRMGIERDRGVARAGRRHDAGRGQHPAVRSAARRRVLRAGRDARLGRRALHAPQTFGGVRARAWTSRATHHRRPAPAWSPAWRRRCTGAARSPPTRSSSPTRTATGSAPPG